MKGDKLMSKRHKKSEEQAQKLALATSTISLITAIINLVGNLLE